MTRHKRALSYSCDARDMRHALEARDMRHGAPRVPFSRAVHDEGLFTYVEEVVCALVERAVCSP